MQLLEIFTGGNKTSIRTLLLPTSEHQCHRYRDQWHENYPKCIEWGMFLMATVTAVRVQKQKHKETASSFRLIHSCPHLKMSVNINLRKSVHLLYMHRFTLHCFLSFSRSPSNTFYPLSEQPGRRAFSAARVTAGLLTIGCRMPCEGSLWRQGLTHLKCEMAPEKERGAKVWHTLPSKC